MKTKFPKYRIVKKTKPFCDPIYYVEKYDGWKTLWSWLEITWFYNFDDAKQKITQLKFLNVLGTKSEVVYSENYDEKFIYLKARDELDRLNR